MSAVESTAKERRAGHRRGFSGRTRRRLRAVIAVALASVGAGVAGCARSADPASRSARPEVLTVGRSPAARPLPAGFLGLSFEFRGLEEYLGTDPSHLNPVFVQLIRNLAPGQRPVVRIGGDSTDWTWWPVPHLRQPGGVHYSLDSRWTQIARALAQSLGARLLVGINFEADSRVIAAQEANSIVRGVGAGSIAALELGNEPELYGGFSWFRTPAGGHVLGRPRSYDFQDYLSDFGRIAAALPNVPVAGPSSGSAKYLARLGDYLSHEPRVRLVAVHAYPLRHCTHSQLPTIAALLAPETTRALAAGIGAYASVAHRHGVALRLDETNSVSCGGYPPVSQSFGAALWALGELFALDRAGVDGVNFHTVPDDSQHLITTTETGGKWTAAVQPEYYGLLAFAQAAPAGSRLIRVSGHLATGVQVYATAAANHQVHVVIINTSGGTRALDLRIPGTTGTVGRTALSGRGLTAQGNVTLGGQSIAPATGALGGTPAANAVTPVGGSYPVSVPGASAVLLTASRR